MPTNTAPAFTDSEREQLKYEARALGAFGATYQTAAIGKCLPLGTALRDCRSKVAGDFIASSDSVVHWLLPYVIAGFDAAAKGMRAHIGAAEDRAPVVAGAEVWCVDAEGADGWLTVGKRYSVHAVRADELLCITDDSGDDAALHHPAHFIPA